MLVVHRETAGALRRLLTFLSDAIRWRKWLGTHGGNESAQHGRKCMPIIRRFVSLPGGVDYCTLSMMTV